MDHYENLNEAGYVGNALGQKENGYGNGGMFYRLFSASKMKLCYTIAKYGRHGEKLIFKGFYDAERLLNTDEFFKMKDGDTTNGEFSLPWQWLFANGVPFDKKETNFNEFKSTLNELKRLAPGEFGKTLPYYYE